MPRFIDLTAAEKNELLIRASAATKISPLLLEKDFWVSWVLNRLFQLDLAKDLTFKGGTSLSKCYDLISRFSEDIDITLDKQLFSEETGFQALSGKQFQKLLDTTEQKAIEYIHNRFKPELEYLISNSLPDNSSWSLIIEENEPKNLRFYYPSSINVSEGSYVKQSVLIEIGVRGEIHPSETKTLQSYVEAHFHNLLETEQAEIKVLSPLRTFWEKVTLIHAENHRPHGKNMGDRLSRHYYDLYQMIQAGIAQSALQDLQLLEDVVRHKTRYFRASWARYEEAIPGTLRAVPHPQLLAYLENDYKQMGSMVFGTIPTFKEILNSLEKFENLINKWPLANCLDSMERIS